ncbi:MAG: hypothetical protein II388_08945, partial [Clostridia bacterium]|nr:hypothetical protein [Clostridia bacterium]
PTVRADNSYLRKQAEEKRRLEEYRKEHNEKAEEFRRLFYGMNKEKDVWKKAEMQSRLDYLEYWFSENEWR